MSRGAGLNDNPAARVPSVPSGQGRRAIHSRPLPGFSPDPEDQRALVARPSEMLGEVLRERVGPEAVRTVYQPIVEFDSQAIVGFEALTRGPAGSRLEAPMSLFAAMREARQLAEFDQACRDAALARAALAGVAPPLTLFLNVEPELVQRLQPADSDATWVRAPGQLRCVIEITERALTSRPAELLAAVAGVRDLSWGVALDDVGADHRSLALMALLRPDVIKLDLRLIQQRPSPEVAEVVAAVNAHAEETGALVLAEGIEHEEHLATALAMGASLGQGYHFGRPGELPATLPAAGPPVRFLGHGLHPDGPTPFDLVRSHQALRRGDAELLDQMTAHLQRQALGQGPATVLLCSEPQLLGDGTLERLEQVAERAALVGVVGGTTQPGGQVRSAAPHHADHLAGEHDTVVISPHYAAALVARALGDGPEREYEFAVTHERELVARCARALAARLAPVDES